MTHQRNRFLDVDSVSPPAPPDDKISKTVFMKKRLETRVDSRVLVIEERSTLGGERVYDVVVGGVSIPSDPRTKGLPVERPGSHVKEISRATLEGLVRLLQEALKES
jgi:hypothetical protein